MATNHKKEIGRAKNAALAFFENKLHIPKIYIDADWGGQKVDLLALDRGGIGDAHVVLMFVREYLPDGQPDFAAQSASMEALRLEFEHITGHYKYIAAVETARLSDWKAVLRIPVAEAESFYAPDFIGRIGVLHIDAPEDGAPRTELVVRPERFRARVGAMADEYVLSHNADWEIRDSLIP